VKNLRRSDDSGQVMVLILGFTVVLGLLVTVVIDASTLFLQRRSLASIADSAALAAAQELDAATYYAGDGLDEVPIDPDAAREAAGGLVAASPAPQLRGVRVARVAVDDGTVEVTVTARVRLPFANLVTGDAEGVRLSVTSAARSPYAD
jgi:Flp pilus assembly protein TadG